MLLQRKTTLQHNAAIERLYGDMNQRLLTAMKNDLSKELASGNIKIVEGRFTSTDKKFQVKRAAIFDIA